MSNNSKQISLQPQLRFPEFRNSGNWAENIFGELYGFVTTNSLSRDKLNYEYGTVKNIHYGDIHTKFRALFDIRNENVPFISEPENVQKEGKLCVEGDVIFADASEDLDDVGKSIEIVNVDGQKLVAGLHTLHARQKSKKLLVGFAGHLFQSSSPRTQIKNEAQGAKVLGISASRLASVRVSYPSDKDEQRKIADCLSSLDQLIEAEGQKLKVLQRHKKGLMQELFPVEGETVPGRRFPGFADSWVTSTIGKVARVTTGGKDTQNKKEGGAYPFFVRSQTVERIDTFSYDGEAILTSGDGVGVGKNFHYINGKFDFHQRVYCICDFNKNVLPKYVYLYFSNYFYSRVSQLSAKNSVDSVRMAMITDMPIGLPSYEEQRCIADCLSLADELILQQRQKLKNLRMHKKGLIQRLFPAVSEVDHG
ncbi:restriction endonuclease subunit S [Agrobacterium sp. ATCC 31749]|uniref:restriction endonuclease subunit S n=2 Tax=unclassified Agrobacterium TaxID=2632611 RepID=UPI0002F74881|nr:restriction endonuclease subunit S [Agrobacterium sp. ATCC 31749]